MWSIIWSIIALLLYIGCVLTLIFCGQRAGKALYKLFPKKEAVISDIFNSLFFASFATMVMIMLGTPSGDLAAPFHAAFTPAFCVVLFLLGVCIETLDRSTKDVPIKNNTEK